MAEVVEALEGTIAPIECITEGADGTVVCSRESDADHVCPTKLLWTRVRFSIVRTLQDTTLSDLVPAKPASPPPPTPDREGDPFMADLEIRNLHVKREDREILRGVDLAVCKGELHALMGPNGSGQVDPRQHDPGPPELRGDRGLDRLQGRGHHRGRPGGPRAGGPVPRLPVPGRIPGVSIANFLRMAINTQREDPINVKEFRDHLQHAVDLLDVDRAFTSRHLNDGFSGGEKKRAEILQMAMLEPEVAVLDETDSGLDIDALRTVAEGVDKLHAERAWAR